MKHSTVYPIYIDVDDVLAETGKALCQCLYKEFGKKISFKEMKQFDLIQSFNISERELKHLFEVFHQTDSLLHIPVVPGAREVVSKWKREGKVIHVFTGRPLRSKETTMEWLNMKGIPFDALHIVDKYGREKEGKGFLSLEQLSGQNYEFAIEDSPQMADFLTKKMDLSVFLLRRPWNSQIPAQGKVIPFKSWKSFDFEKPPSV